MTTAEFVVVAALLTIAAGLWDRAHRRHRRRTEQEGSPHMSTKPLDMDKILDQAEEATGSRDRFSFVMFGQEWSAVDPARADDGWLDELQDLGDENGPVADVGEHYMGDEQYAKFVEAGGSFTLLNRAVTEHRRRIESRDDDGHPTRRSNSSRGTRRR